MRPTRSSPTRISALLILAVAGATAAHAQITRPGNITQTYAQLCANCHGANLEGGQAQSLLDDVWVAGGDDESLAKSIRNGFPEKGMPAWGAAIPEKEIRAMVIYIHELRSKHQRENTQFTKPAASITAKSKLLTFKLDTWIPDVKEPYSLAFLSSKTALMTEKLGRAFLIESGKIADAPISGLPVVDTGSQAGLFDVVPHPNYARNGWIYFAYADPQKNEKGENVSLTRIVRGKLRDGAFVDQQTVYEAKREHYIKAGGVHFGGRIVFDKQGYLFFSIGERGQRDHAQMLDRPNGKIHRIHDDGRVPNDNPFARNPKALPTVWSYGHRNPQGLAIHPVTGQLYDAEHGPRGGDELNLVEKGKNYGWPVITYGMEYDGRAITDNPVREGMEQPITYWLPSIAPCGINFYAGDKFAKWKNQLFVTSLAAQELRRVELKGEQVVTQEILFKGTDKTERMRHVIAGPDGAIYVLFQNRIARMTPAQ
jgi:glucose/arabinose dehydrogenase